MAQACERCGGVGYGFLDPDGEAGWRSGTPKGQPPAPCPDCEAQFEEIKKNPKALTIYDNNGKVDRKLDPKKLTLGVYIDPQRAPEKKQTIQAIDSDGRNLSDDAFDPGVVETGNAKVTIEEALAATAAEAGGE